MKKPRGTLISFASAANHGKSSMAIKLFLYLLEHGVDVEYIQESYKHHYYRSKEIKNHLRPTFDDLSTIVGALKRKSIVIYDSSFLNPFCYSNPLPPPDAQTLKEFVCTNVKRDVYIHIPKMMLPFDPSSRFQSSAEECVKINTRFQQCLEAFNIPYISASFNSQSTLNQEVHKALRLLNPSVTV